MFHSVLSCATETLILLKYTVKFVSSFREMNQTSIMRTKWLCHWNTVRVRRRCVSVLSAVRSIRNQAAMVRFKQRGGGDGGGRDTGGGEGGRDTGGGGKGGRDRGGGGLVELRVWRSRKWLIVKCCWWTGSCLMNSPNEKRSFFFVSLTSVVFTLHLSSHWWCPHWGGGGVYPLGSTPSPHSSVSSVDHPSMDLSAHLKPLDPGSTGFECVFIGGVKWQTCEQLGPGAVITWIQSRMKSLYGSSKVLQIWGSVGAVEETLCVMWLSLTCEETWKLSETKVKELLTWTQIWI